MKDEKPKVIDGVKKPNAEEKENLAPTPVDKKAGVKDVKVLITSYFLYS